MTTEELSPSTEELSPSNQERAPADLESLRELLRALAPVVVAFSGGADSAFLAWVAHDTLGADAAQAVTAVSPSLATGELADCAALVSEWGLRWSTVATDEMDVASYTANGADRCYWCKASLMSAASAVARSFGDATIALGVNLDDLSDHRPGQQAAAERGARFPLVEAGFAKSDVREWSRRLGLRTWDKPAAACLSSRLPYGTAVTIGRLSQVDRAESALARLGFPALRVRHYDDTARIEVPLEHLDALIARRAQVVEAVRAAGYRYVTVDLEGLRSGNLNQALD